MNCTECGNTGFVRVEKGPAGATYTVLAKCKCQPIEITIPRAQYEALISDQAELVSLKLYIEELERKNEALMAAAFWLLKLRSLGYVQAGHGRKITDEILSIIRATGVEIKADSARDERLRAIGRRAAGIDLEDKT